MMMMMMITMMLYMPGTIKSNEIVGRNHKIRVLILALEDSDLSLFQDASSNDKVFFSVLLIPSDECWYGNLN